MERRVSSQIAGSWRCLHDAKSHHLHDVRKNDKLICRVYDKRIIVNSPCILALDDSLHIYAPNSKIVDIYYLTSRLGCQFARPGDQFTNVVKS